MEVYTMRTSKVFILGEEGFRRPDVTEVEFADALPKTVIFDKAVTDLPIRKCRCKDEEIIIERTNNEELKISTAYKAPQSLYKYILAMAVEGNYKLVLNKCENLHDTFYVDKLVENYMKVY